MSPGPLRRGRAWVVRSAMWIPASVIALLMAPMALTARSFGTDWTLHLWLVRQQQLNIDATGRPSLFVSAHPLGVFYPIFAFLGSGIYTVGGYLAVALGDRPLLAFKILNFGGLCLACGGMAWLARQLGVRGWRSQIPGVVFVTGTYLVTDMVGRGDFAEFMALCSLPFVLAALRAACTAESLRPPHLLALASGAFVLTGTHNITLMWGLMFLGVLGAVLLFAFASQGRPPLPLARLAGVGVGLAVGVGLNAWFLFADFASSLDTAVAGQNAHGLSKLTLVQPGLLLNPLRTAAPTESLFTRDLRLTLPWMAFAWAVTAVGLTWRHRDGVSRRLFSGLTVVALGYVALTISTWPWRFVPHAFYNVQFLWRLHGYVLLTTALLVMVALASTGRGSGRSARVVSGALIAIVVFNVAMSSWQEWRVRSEYVRHGHVVVAGPHFLDTVIASRDEAPPSWYGHGDFRDVSSPVVDTAPDRALVVPVAAVHGSSFAGVLPVPAGPAPFVTNISAGPKFVRMTGIRAVGRNADGLVVAVRASDAPASGPVRVTINSAATPLLRDGDRVSVVALLAVIGLLVWLAFDLVAPRPRRRRGGSPTENDVPVRPPPRVSRIAEPVGV